jgi:hypothetical protein
MNKTPVFHTLCKQTGKHDWRATTSENFKVCGRPGCQAATRLYERDKATGEAVWIDATSPLPFRRRSSRRAQPMAQQAVLDF